MNVPSELKYTKTHEWLQVLDDGTVRVGITDHAQELLGDMVFVETPAIGRILAADEECGVLESVKSAADMLNPVAGEVLEVNETLDDSPESINDDAYGAWLFRLRPANPADLDNLLSAADYQAMAEAEASE